MFICGASVTWLRRPTTGSGACQVQRPGRSADPPQTWGWLTRTFPSLRSHVSSVSQYALLLLDIGFDTGQTKARWGKEDGKTGWRNGWINASRVSRRGLLEARPVSQLPERGLSIVLRNSQPTRWKISEGQNISLPGVYPAQQQQCTHCISSLCNRGERKQHLDLKHRRQKLILKSQSKSRSSAPNQDLQN